MNVPGLTLMAVHAHPDDEVTGTGGVLARYAAEGVDTDAVADRLVNWWTAASTPAGQPDTPPCPACGTGAGQSSSPEQLHRSVCYCGHPRYYDDRHRDGSCPCQTSGQ